MLPETLYNAMQRCELNGNVYNRIINQVQKPFTNLLAIATGYCYSEYHNKQQQNGKDYRGKCLFH